MDFIKLLIAIIISGLCTFFIIRLGLKRIDNDLDIEKNKHDRFFGRYKNRR